MNLEATIDYRSMHMRQSRMPQVLLNIQDHPREQTITGGAEDHIKFTPEFTKLKITNNLPRNLIPHPERLQLVEQDERILPFPKKGIIYHDKQAMAAD